MRAELHHRSFREREALAKMRKSRYLVSPEIRAQRAAQLAAGEQATLEYDAERRRHEQLRQLGPVREFLTLLAPLPQADVRRVIDIVERVDLSRFRAQLLQSRAVLDTAEPEGKAKKAR